MSLGISAAMNIAAFSKGKRKRKNLKGGGGGGGGIGGRIVLTKSEIKIFCHIDTRFPWKTRHIPTPKMFGGSNETIFLHFGGLRNTQNGEN